MPTFNQLIHNGRAVAEQKSKAPAPVSYTHLDVYKRQIPNWGLRKLPVTSPMSMKIC